MISLDSIREAEATVRGSVHRTPITTSASVCERCAAAPGTIRFKMENQQRTGSFKIRGAVNRLTHVDDKDRALGVVTASAGNHAQGLALAGGLTQTPVQVFMPESASIAKIQATRGYGAEVTLAGSSFSEAEEAARAWEAEHGARFVSAFDDDLIIAGQGTLGIEIAEEVEDLAAVVIPVGGGGLFAGVATAVRALRPKARIVGVQAAGAPAAVESWSAGKLLPPSEPRTIADGIAIKSPSDRTFAYLKQYADEMITVDDREIARAMLLLLERAKTVVEPAGAASVAALLSGRVKVNGPTVAIVSGGNVDAKLLADLIEREMIRADRYMHLFTAVPDRPGGLAALLNVIAEQRGNVLTVVHNRISPSVPLGETGVELLIEVRDAGHIEQIRTALTARGYRVEFLDSGTQNVL